MVIRKSIPLRWLLFYTWRSLVVVNLLTVAAVVLKKYFDVVIEMPITTVTIFAAALSIYLGFRSNNAYDRWWEARTIWGALVNSSRAWARQVTTLLTPSDRLDEGAIAAARRELVHRHIAFAHALRVFLRGGRSVAHETGPELLQASNTYEDMRPYLDPDEYEAIRGCDNPPNMLLQRQGQRLAELARQGALSDFRLVHLDGTLVEFNHVQGRSERIKSTAFIRSYSWFQRVFVWTHAIIVPFAYVNLLGWSVVPIAFVLNYVFLSIDFISSRTEDPFENRHDDVPLSTICRTIEINLLEVLEDKPLPPRLDPVDGVLF